MSPAPNEPHPFDPVFLRFGISALRFTRICASHRCRRETRCTDGVNLIPRCLGLLHPVDLGELQAQVRIVTDIIDGSYRPQRSEDRKIRAREYDAINLLVDCRSLFSPEIWQDLLAWIDRYDASAAAAPPAAPTPPAAAATTAVPTPPATLASSATLAPPAALAPPVDTRALLAEMKATLERDRLRSELSAMR